jgi:integrase
MKLKLDIRTINALALAKGRNEDFAWDSELENFGLRLRRGADGIHRTFCVQYRQHGRTRRCTIGSTERLTLAQARQHARKLLAKVSLGADPKAERDAGRVAAGRTFGTAVELYLAAKAAHARPATLRASRLYLTGRYFKPLHGAALAQISRADVAARLSAISRDHSPNTAAVARRHVSALFSWLMQEGWLEANPAIGTRRPIAAPSRDRVLADRELGAIWRAAGDDDYGRIVRLLILTGCRRQEIGGMQWSELDLSAGTWTLPPSRSKNRRAHTVPLPPAAIEIINAVSQNGRAYLFGERGAQGYSTWSRGKAELDRRLGDKVQPWTVHDLRRSVATRLADIGIPPHIVETILGHHSGHKAGTAGTYNRSIYGAAVKAALARWAEYVMALAEGRQSNIVTLHA